MPYIIDGHNLIGKTPGLRLEDPEDEKNLIDLLQDFCQKKGKRAEVYFDKGAMGHASANVIGRITARFVRDGETADTAITRRLKSLGKEAANWTLVSSDNEVKAAGKRARAKVISSVDFANQLLNREVPKTERVDETLSAEEVDDWLDLFENSDEID